MNYRFTIDQNSYEDLASGRVLYNQHGSTAFPVRMASELFGRAESYLMGKGHSGPYRIYDPCAGGAYLLTSIGFLHGERIASIAASDIDPQAVELAARNLSLLTTEGLDERRNQLEKLYDSFGKQSHKDALDSVERLKALIGDTPVSRAMKCFAADATEPIEALRGIEFDIIISDVPYGHTVAWKTEADYPAERMLDQLAPLLAPVSIVVLIAMKDQKIAHDRYEQVGQFKLGKRRAILLKLK